MNSAEWHELNSEYTELAVRWVRYRLEWAVRRGGVANEQPQHQRRSLFRRIYDWLCGRRAPLVIDGEDECANEAHSHAEERILARMRAIDNQLDGGQPTVLTGLVRSLGLRPFERHVVMLCMAFELNTAIGGLCASATRDPQRPYPTFALALGMFPRPEWGLAPEQSLRKYRLVEVQQPAGTPLAQAALRLDEHVLHLLKGWRNLDDRLALIMTPVEQDSRAPLCPTQADVVERILTHWHTDTDRHSDALTAVQLLGGDVESKLLVAAAVAAQLGRRLLKLSWEQLPVSPIEVEHLVALWQRERRLYGLLLYIDADDDGGLTDPANVGRIPALQRLLSGAGGRVFLGSRDVGPRLGPARLTLDVDKPTVPEQHSMWVQHLGPSHEATAEVLAAQFRLNEPEIAAIAASSHATPYDTERELESRLWSVCRLKTRPRLVGLAQRIEAVATWDDLILPNAQQGQLRELAAQARHRWRVYDEWGFRARLSRGLGISALFAGESGTGKTMAAEVLANALNLDLYRVDLSAVVSKYIGETEKNLRKVFDAFEDCGAVCFFDECDALFGKRTEVKDSHDRYANIEVSYLLQRLESYRGLAILATNNKSGLDRAFLRRLRFVVTFPQPEAAARAAIWQRLLPPQGEAQVPTAALDYHWLGKWDLSGGQIQTASLNGAFLAAQHGRDAVTMSDLRDAITAELIKQGRPIRPTDLELPASPHVMNRSFDFRQSMPMLAEPFAEPDE